MEAKPLDWSRGAPARRLSSGWLVVLGLAILAIPTLASMAKEHWSTEAGAHGPIVLATGGWLIWRRLQEQVVVGRGSLGVTLLILLPSLTLYVFGRAFDYLILQATGLYGAGVAAAYDRWGRELVHALWFPLVYLALAIPLPSWLLDYATAPLKQFVSAATTHLLQAFGLPIVREGVTLFVAQYQLLVADACAGLNSIVGLTALGLFYSYLSHGPSLRQALLLMVFILPIAIVANVVRIVLLVLITLYAGDEAAQGYLHGVAGLLMFATALLLVFAVDSALSRWKIMRGPAAT